MAMANNANKIIKMDTANDEVTGGVQLMGLTLVANTANAQALLVETAGGVVAGLSSLANSSCVVMFPKPINLRGIKLSAISGTGALVYVYLA